MRQCILLYVLLLLFYPWVMPDTRMYESLSSIFCPAFSLCIRSITAANLLSIR